MEREFYVKPQEKGFLRCFGRRRKLYVELGKNGKPRQLYSIPDEYRRSDHFLLLGANSSMEDILIRSQGHLLPAICVICHWL